MNSQQFIDIVNRAQVGNSLLAIAAAVIIITYLMISKMPKKHN